MSATSSTTSVKAKKLNLVLGVFSLVQAPWSVAQIIMNWDDSLLLVILHIGGAIGWFLGGVIWLRLYRMQKRHATGWATLPRNGFKGIVYVGDGETVDSSTWDVFARDVNNVLYPVMAGTTKISRDVFAARLNTHVGLVNDLYPCEPTTNLHRMIKTLTAVDATASPWRRARHRHRIMRLHKNLGWLTSVRNATVTNFLADDPGYGANGYEEFTRYLHGSMQLPNDAAHAFAQNLWQLYYLFAQPEKLVAEMMNANRPFNPTPLIPLVRRWTRVYGTLSV